MNPVRIGERVARGVSLEVHLHPEDVRRQLRDDVRRGLSATPKELPPKWFYDERGSQLFDEITRLPEYYPTRRERAILQARAAEVAAATDAEVLIELGSGTSSKTRLLLDALYARGSLRTFVPFDVSAETLRAAAGSVSREYPGVAVRGIVGDFEYHLARLPRGGRCLIAFFGGTIGNLYPSARTGFLREVATLAGADGAFLLGTDLEKDAERLRAAYDDARGVTAEFNRNVLRVVNRELGADFEPEAFEHVARYDTRNAWIEMALRSRVEQTVTVRDLGMEVRFRAGEEMRTEISAKFTRERIERELSEAGLALERWWTDRAGDFALSLSVGRA